jgi:hypothetical protein
MNIKFLVAEFNFVTFLLVGRHLNEAAHILARSCDVLAHVLFLFLSRIVSGRLCVLILFDQ